MLNTTGRGRGFSQIIYSRVHDTHERAHRQPRCGLFVPTRRESERGRQSVASASAPVRSWTEEEG